MKHGRQIASHLFSAGALLRLSTYHLSHKHERNTYMKLEIDWLEMAKAVAKAIWPFIAGAFGGLFSGCTFGGIGPNFI